MCPSCTIWVAAVSLMIPAAHGQGSTPATPQPAPAASSVPEQTVEELFADFIHFAKLGRFTAAEAAAQTLLNHPHLTPLLLLEVSTRYPDSIDTLQNLIAARASIADTAQRVLDVILKGEFEKRKDLERIRENIRLLGSHPQAMALAIRNLKNSGEYAIPSLVETLQDADQESLWPRIVRALPQLGKPAVNPLVMALAVDDENVRQSLVRSLGEIGYPQAVPYLRKLMAAPKVSSDTKKEAATAIKRIETLIGRPVPGAPPELFFRLAEQYYDEDEAVRADPRLDEANVWYWDVKDQALTAKAVSRKIFGQVMAMRCCEEALLLENSNRPAHALWLAANTRREARLGMNVQSDDPSEQGADDPTRPDVFPRALYYTQASGPSYAHLMLARAVKDRDADVALGAIEALRTTAGQASLIGTEDEKQPLAQSLRFPDILVRIRAALALGAALPQTQFSDSQFVVPILSETLALSGKEQVVVIDADDDDLNRVMSDLREGDREVLGDASFFRGLQRARAEVEHVLAFFLASNMTEPDVALALSRLRSEFLFEKTPVVLLVKRGDSLTADQIAERDAYVQVVSGEADRSALEEALQRVRERTGQSAIDADLAQSLALEAVEILHGIAVNGRTIYELNGAAPALIGALASPHEELQTRAAAVLAYVSDAQAQRAIAHVALDDAKAKSLRLSMFDSLAESAKMHGAALDDAQVGRLVKIVRDEKDLEIRTQAGKALGALNVRTQESSEIIRSFYGG